MITLRKSRRITSSEFEAIRPSWPANHLTVLQSYSGSCLYIVVVLMFCGQCGFTGCDLNQLFTGSPATRVCFVSVCVET
ncbi:hypothetical protein CHARACLAT_009070 [Characodon lateralis]|uniref:Uncharacterized protein n=1 Tax=Characodon lateralis TaxID=208331 RepID=A0ABU7DQ31_9TELE|nr:hypothetical protein [Characodon lateralis]